VKNERQAHGTVSGQHDSLVSVQAWGVLYISIASRAFALHSVPSNGHIDREVRPLGSWNVRLMPDCDCRRFNGALSVALTRRSGSPEDARGRHWKAKHWMTASRTFAVVVAHSFLHPAIVKTPKHDAGAGAQVGCFGWERMDQCCSSSLR
jgi:hypothetical protein